MEKEKNTTLNRLIKAIGVIFLYFFITFAYSDFLWLFGINYYNLNSVARTIYLILYDIGLAILLIFIYRKDFIIGFKDFKNNFSKYLDYIWLWISSLVLMVISNLIIVNFTINKVATNQQAAIDQLHYFPIYLIISSIITAPIIEEIIFRLTFRKVIKNNILFIIISGFVFGALHVITSYTNITDLLFIIPYSIPGCAFAYMLVKTDNICVPISMHMLHNTIMIIFQLIAMIK